MLYGIYMIVGSGLLLDIIGVVILFICTSTSKIEAEMSYKIVKGMTPGPGEEWVHSIIYEEHNKRLDDT